jgi:hypothetical protein
MNQQNPESQPSKSIPFWKVVLSVIQASFGVQSNSNRERDFTQGKLWAFVIAALLFTVVFVLTIVFVVSLVLPD